MGMRAHIEAVPAFELRRAEMVEEHERPDGAAQRMRQRTADREALPEIDAARNNDDIQRIAGVAIAGRGVLAGKKAHGFSPLDWG